MLPTSDQDHRLLFDAAQSFLSERCPPRWVRQAPRWAAADTRQLWTEMARLGWLGMLMPADDDGGLGLTMQELAIVAERVGAHLLPLPLLETAVLGACLRRLAPELPLPTQALCEGEASLGRLDLARDYQDSLFNHHGQCTHVVVTQALSDGSLRVCLATADALQLEEAVPLDPACPVARLAPRHRRTAELEAAPAVVLAPDAARDLEISWRMARLADLLGASGAAFDLTLAYVRERVQFGAVIGSFQAIKHRLADSAMALDAARLAVWDAAIRMSQEPNSPDDMEQAVDHAHVAVDCIATRMRSEVIQLHGGIGFTWECDAHLYQKRIIRLMAGLPSGPAIGRIADRLIPAEVA